MIYDKKMLQSLFLTAVVHTPDGENQEAQIILPVNAVLAISESEAYTLTKQQVPPEHRGKKLQFYLFRPVESMPVLHIEPTWEEEMCATC